MRSLFVNVRQLRTIFAVWLVWRKFPHLRLGQLIVNASHETKATVSPVFYVANDALVFGLKNFRRKYGR